MEPMKLDSLAIAAASNLAEVSVCGACELSDMEPKKVIVPGMEREKVVIASANANLRKSFTKAAAVDGAIHKQPKKKRNGARRSGPGTVMESDKATLEDREEEGRNKLREIGIDPDTLTLRLAVQLHLTTENKEIRRAIRVCTVANSCVEDDTKLLTFFREELSATLYALPIMQKSQVMQEAYSVFLKAALHKVEPQKHLPKGACAKDLID